jgi:hypothetical protein
MSRTRKKSRRKLDTIANSVATVNNLATGQTLVYSDNAWSNGYPQGFGAYPVDITGILPNQTLVWNGTRWAPATATVSVTGRSYLGANPYLANVTGGDQVRLTGTGLAAVQSVVIDNNVVSVFAATPTALTITTPALASGFHVIYLVTAVNTYRVAQSLAAGTTIVLVVGTPDITLDSAAAYSNNLTITGGVGAVTISLSGTLTSFLTYLNGTVSGTLPRVSQDMSYSYTITATDGVQTVSAIATVTVKFIPILWVTPAGNIRTVSDAARTGFSFTLSATYRSSPITVFGLTSGALPSGLTLNTTTGVISGDIAGSISNTVFSFTVTAFTSDGFTSNARVFSITVNAAIVDTSLNAVPLLLKTSPVLTNLIVPDLSANGIAVTKSSAGSPATGSTGPYQTDGYWSNQFNGSSDYLQFPAGTAFAPGTGDFTLEGWVYVITHNTSQGNFFWTQSTPGTNYFLLTFGTSGAGWTAISSGVGPTISGPTVTINTNTWYHLAVTRASGTVRVYVNGVSGTAGTNTTDISNTSWTPTLGSYTHVSWGLWAGYVSNVRYVKGVAVYSGSFTPPSLAPLTAAGATSAACYPSTTNVNTTFAASNTSLLTCQSNRFKDNSVNNFSVSVIGAPRTSFNFYPTGFTAPAASLGAALFNNNFLSMTSSTNLTIGTSSATVEFWMYSSATDGFRRIVVSTLGAFSNGTFVIRYNNGTFIAGSGAVAVSTSTLPATNRWTHVAWVGTTGTSQTLYFNGVSVGTAAAYNITEAIQYIGGYYSVNGTEYYLGFISNLRVVKGTAVYTGNFSPPSNFLQTAGAASAASYTNTANVNTTFPAANTSLLLNFADSSYITASNGAQNNVFIDSSSNNFPITRTGTPTQGSLTPYWPNGYWSNYFDGSNSYIRTTGVSFTSPSFTIECWFYFTGSAANQSIYDFSAGLGTYGVYTAISGSIISTQFYSTNASGSLIGMISTPYANYLNQWVHLAVTFNGATYRMYLNGVSVGTPISSTTQIVTLTVLTVGGRSDSTQVAGYGWVGYVSNLRYVRGTVVYTGNFIPPTAPLQKTQFGNGGTTQAITETQTAFLTCQSYRFLDNSSNNFTLTPNSAPQVRPVHPFLLTNNYSAAAYGGSGYFNGTTDYLLRSFSSTTDGMYPQGTTYTFEAWIYLNPNTLDNIVYEVDAINTGSFGQWGIGVAGTTRTIGFAYRPTTGGTSVAVITGSALAANTWHHVALSVSSGSARLFLNGVQTGSTATISAISYTPGGASIGNLANGYTDGISRVFNGYISNLRLVQGVAVYTGNFTPPTLAPLTTAGSTSAASYPSTTNVNTTFASSSTGLLLNFANAAIYDAAAQNVVITVSNAQVSIAQSQWPPSSIFFNGGTSALSVPSSTAFGLGTGDWTIEFWIYLNALPAVNVTLVSMLTNISGAGFAPHIYYAAGSGIRYYTNSTDRINGAALASGVWNYVAVSKASGNTRMYINGTQTGSTYPDPNNYGAANPFAVADYAVPLAGGTVNGYFQDVRITRGIARAVTAIPTEEFPTIAANPLIVSGQTAYTTAGTYFWTAPANVTSVCVVCVGGGGSGGTDWSSTRSSTGGGGGALAWGNDIPVVPGVSYTVVVGDGGAGFTGSINSNGNPGGISYFISDTYLAAGGGGAGIHKGAGSSSGGAPVISASITSGGGGAGGGSTQPTGTFRGVGGGGAGGYSGNGGSASWGSNGTAAAAGSGGGGGGGSTSTSGGGGGGVGILGRGTDGIGGTGTGGGSGGSSGSSGTAGVQNGGGTGSPGVYGGGSGGHAKNGNPTGEWSVAGGSGAVRIIWGPGRSFPNNAANV